jgi:inward rectifier potassium channel
VKLIYSEKAVIAPYKDITAFEFRIANARKNQLIEAEVQVILSMKKTIDGKRVRKFHELELERTKVNFFALSWTIVHPIGENSPLYGITKSELDASDAEFLIIFKAFDDTFSQTVHSRYSYKFNEVSWNSKFKNMFVDSEKDISVIDLGKIHHIEEN